MGNTPSRALLGFNTGNYETIDLSMWMAGNPVDVLATNFGKPASLFEKFPHGDVFIADKDGNQRVDRTAAGLTCLASRREEEADNTASLLTGNKHARRGRARHGPKFSPECLAGVGARLPLPR